MIEGVKPYYHADGVWLYHGDCRELLPLIPEASVDLVLTDPPYGLGDKWNGGTWGAQEMYADARQWDRPVEFADVWAAVVRGKHAIVWGCNYHSGFPACRGLLAWIKNPPMGTMADFELAWTTFDYPAKAIVEHRNPDGKRFHPTQKPESVTAWCIQQADKHALADIVLDPYAGSGTTLIAAKQLNRQAIGVEIEERYCEIAAKRLEAADRGISVKELDRGQGVLWDAPS